MKKLFHLLFLFSFCLSFGQTITIYNEEGFPLENVNIFSEDKSISSISDSLGKANINKFSNDQKIIISSIGFNPTQTTKRKLLYNNTLKVVLVSSKTTLKDVVYSATKWKDFSDNVPQSHIVLDTEKSSLLNPQTTADLLGQSGKVFIQKSQQGGGSPMIRGFSANRLLYTIDGVRMNTAIFRSGNIHNVISIDPFTIQNSEVLFGPGSVIYGSDAIGGVMSFYTLKPKFSKNNQLKTGLNFTTRYSSANNESTNHIDFNLGFKNWAFLTSVTFSDFDDLKMGRHGPEEFLRRNFVITKDDFDLVVSNKNPRIQTPSAYSQLNLMQKVSFSNLNNINIDYGFHFSESSSFSKFDRYLQERDGFPRHAQWDYGPQKWMMNNVSLGFKSNNQFFNIFNINLAHQKFEESRITRNFNNPIQTVRTENLNAYSVNIDFLKEKKKTKSHYGLEYVLNELDSKVEENSNNFFQRGFLELSTPLSRYPDSYWHSIGGYYNFQYTISDKITFNSAVRFNHFIVRSSFDTTAIPLPFTNINNDFSTISGNLGLVFTPSSNCLIKTTISKGFRAPNVDDIGKVFDSEPGAVVVPNNNINAEKAYNFDLEINKKFADVLSVGITAFYTILDDALIRRDFTFNGHDSIIYDGVISKVQAIQNATSAKVYGFQTDINIRLAEQLNFQSILNFQKGTEKSEHGIRTPTRHAAPIFGRVNLDYSYNKWKARLSLNYQDEVEYENLALSERRKVEIYAVDSNGNPYAPAWYSLDFMVQRQIFDNTSLTFGVQNITDQLYRPYSSGISAPGRNFVFSFSVSI